jgi:glycerophosphoryl diester phosphodiesterase
VPTLTEIAGVCRGKVVMMLDLKHRRQGHALARWIAENRFPIDQLILGPWEIEEGNDIRQHVPSARLVLIVEHCPPDTGEWIRTLRETDFDGISIDHQLLTPGLVSSARQNRLKVYTWTVNEPYDLRRARDLGVDGIITDDPALARRELQ